MSTDHVTAPTLIHHTGPRLPSGLETAHRSYQRRTPEAVAPPRHRAVTAAELTGIENLVAESFLAEVQNISPEYPNSGRNSNSPCPLPYPPPHPLAPVGSPNLFHFGGIGPSQDPNQARPHLSPPPSFSRKTAQLWKFATGTSPSLLSHRYPKSEPGPSNGGRHSYSGPCRREQRRQP